MIYPFLWLLQITRIYEFTIFDFFRWNVPWTLIFMMFLDVPCNFRSSGVFDVTNGTIENENIGFMKSLKMSAVVGQLFGVITRSSTAGHRTSHSPFLAILLLPHLEKDFPPPHPEVLKHLLLSCQILLNFRQDIHVIIYKYIP